MWSSSSSKSKSKVEEDVEAAGMREGARETTRTRTRTTLVELPEEKVLVARSKTMASSGIHTVALECTPTLPTKGLILHWALFEATTRSRGTCYRESCFHPGRRCIKRRRCKRHFKNDKTDDCFRRRGEGDSFGMKNEETGKWITGPNKKDFVIRLDGKRDEGDTSAVPTTTAAVPTPSPPPTSTPTVPTTP